MNEVMSAFFLFAATASAAYAPGLRPRPAVEVHPAVSTWRCTSTANGRCTAVHCMADSQLDGNSGFEEEGDTSVSRRSPAPLTVALQAMHMTAAASALTAPIGEGPMDKAVAALWDAFERAAVVTHDPMFEANVAVLAFVAWIAFFESLHTWWPNAIEVSTPSRLPSVRSPA